MATHLVFTVIAKDRPGLVEKLSDIVAGLQGNWIDSSMARLGEEFAGIVRVSIPNEKANELQSGFEALAAEGIDITLRSSNVELAKPSGVSAHLDLVCQDHTGILHEITSVLAREGVSIEHLNTEISKGSMQGEAMFKASAKLRLPEGKSPAHLREALEETAADLMADIEIAD